MRMTHYGVRLSLMGLCQAPERVEVHHYHHHHCPRLTIRSKASDEAEEVALDCQSQLSVVWVGTQRSAEAFN